MNPSNDLLTSSTASLETAQLIKQLPSAIAFFDMHGRFAMVSDPLATLLGMSPEALTGKSIAQIHVEQYTIALDLVHQCLKKPKPQTKRFQPELDTKTWLEAIVKPWLDDNQQIIGAILDIKNVTDQVGAQLRNNQLSVLLEETAEISKVGRWEFDIVNNRLIWSEMTKKIHEVPSDYEPELESAIEFYKEGYDRNTIAMMFQKTLDDGNPFSAKLQIVTQKGNERWITTAGKPIKKDGTIVKIIGTFQDVDEQARAEMKIRDNEKLLRTIIDNIPLNLYIKDVNSKKILVNRSECNFFGETDPEKLLGKNNHDLFDEETAKRLRDEDLFVIKNDQPIVAREELIKKTDGTEHPFLVSKIPLKDSLGNTYGLIGISVDIGTIKKKEEELQRLVDITSVQNKKLMNFAHIVSHNLRSHSANLSMLLNFLIKEKDGDEKKRITQMLVNASDNLMETLKDLNNVVEINTNISLEKKPINLNAKLKKTENNLTLFLRESNTKIVNKIPANIKVLGISAYVDSILLNLLTNAVKYRHPNRSPVIRLSVEKTKTHTVLIVSDNGLGIDMEKNGDKLFGMYKTFHKNKDSRGIGLYITKNQMEAMGGNITAESTVGVGTTFKVCFNEI